MKTVLAIATAILLLSCATSGSLYESSPALTPIPMSDFNVSIVDSRTGVEDRELYVPAVSLPRDEDAVSPTLPDSLEPLAREVIGRAQTEGSDVLKFVIEILEGEQTFDARAFSETEEVNWRLRLTIARVDGSVQAQVNGESRGRRTSIDASPDRIREMYLDAFERALEDALSRV